LRHKFCQFLSALVKVHIEILRLVILPFELFELQPVLAESNGVHLRKTAGSSDEENEGNENYSAELCHTDNVDIEYKITCLALIVKNHFKIALPGPKERHPELAEGSVERVRIIQTAFDKLRLTVLKITYNVECKIFRI
jgi:hypothetical protein